MKSVKYLIIGAGISGLAFAARKEGEDYILIEQEDRPGGICKTFKEAGFVWDYAGHFFHFHSDETKEYFEDLMQGRQMRPVKKKAMAFYADNYMDAPFQYNVDQLSKEECLECLMDLYFANGVLTGESFTEFVKGKYGNGISDKFLIPYNEKLYACSLDTLDRSAMGKFLPKLDFDTLMNQLKKKQAMKYEAQTYNDSFDYPIEGCGEVIEALCDRIDRSRIKLNESAIKIDAEKKKVITDKDEYEYEYLISTIPLVSFLKASNNQQYKKLNYNTVVVLNLGFDKPSIDKTIHWVYYPGDEVFYRVGFYNNINGTERLNLYVEIGLPVESTVDYDTLMERTLADLRKARVIDGHQLIAHNILQIRPAYVHITTEGKQFVDKYIAEQKKYSTYFIGRYARWEYSAMDDSLEQAKTLAEEI